MIAAIFQEPELKKTAPSAPGLNDASCCLNMIAILYLCWKMDASALESAGWVSESREQVTLKSEPAFQIIDQGEYIVPPPGFPMNSSHLSREDSRYIGRYRAQISVR